MIFKEALPQCCNKGFLYDKEVNTDLLEPAGRVKCPFPSELFLISFFMLGSRGSLFESPPGALLIEDSWRDSSVWICRLIHCLKIGHYDFRLLLL
jgi:hypothetical protein